MNYIQELALQLIGRHKRGHGGWLNYNCSYCTKMGESRNDTKLRGGLLILPTGGIKYNCFNCKFKTTWQPGKFISRKIIDYWVTQFVTSEQIDRARYECLKLQEEFAGVPIGGVDDTLTLEEALKPAELPHGCLKLNSAVMRHDKNTSLIRALSYIEQRNPRLLQWFQEIYWTPHDSKKNYSDYIIFPLYHSGMLYGWTGRRTTDTVTAGTAIPRWIGDNKLKFMFNSDKLYSSTRDSVILTEGIFDAISVDGVALLGSEVTPSQKTLIQQSNKKIIVLPDRDSSGKTLIDIAIKNNWYVSFPPFDSKVKDAFEAASMYGRLLTIRLIQDYAIKCPIQIKAKSIDWFKG